MRSIICRSGVLAAVLALIGAGVAGADTILGTTTPPTGSSAVPCSGGGVYAQTGSASSTPYSLAASGILKKWSTNVTGGSTGADVYLVVLRQSGSTWGVVGVDQEKVPASPPAGGIATFTIAAPILAEPGEVLGLYSTSSSLTCAWQGSGIPSGATVGGFTGPGPAPLTAPPTEGQTLSEVVSGSGEVNVSAVVGPAIADAAVSAGFAPARPTVGALAVLRANVVNHGPTRATINFTDTVPAGLRVKAASAGGGTCSVAGQLVSCTIASLASGRSSRVSVITLLKRTGAFTNSVSVSLPAGLKDPHLANNSSTATMKVTKPTPTRCTVPQLKATPEDVARQVLKLLGCKVRVTLKSGHGVPKGTVLKTQPRSGTYALNRLITVIVRK